MLGLAAASQILVSSTTAELIRGAGFALENLGEHKLRGVDAPRRIFAVA
jgi:class 3 adenylate cyclase